MSKTKKQTALKVRYRGLDDLEPYARNARTHSDEQVAQIAASMREFGFTNPVLVDGKGGIIAGHGRVLAARQIGLEQVPTIELGHLSEAQKRAYVIADNKLALNAGWNTDLLAAELGELRGLGVDLALTGFGDGELATLLAPPVDPEPPADFDAYDENVPVQHKCPKCGYQWSGKPS